MDNTARYVNALLGLWLLISAFLWPHSHDQFNNSWLVGILATLASFGAMRTPWLRYVNTALAVWLFATTLAFSWLSQGTIWNNAAVAVAMFIASLVPSGPSRGLTNLPRTV